MSTESADNKVLDAVRVAEKDFFIKEIVLSTASLYRAILVTPPGPARQRISDFLLKLRVVRRELELERGRSKISGGLRNIIQDLLVTVKRFLDVVPESAENGVQVLKEES